MYCELKTGKARKKKKNSEWTYKDSKGNNMLINIEVSVVRRKKYLQSRVEKIT